VLATLKAGTAVSGYTYKENWIRVNTEDGRTGWVHRSLVMAR
jgi:SH3-like domain-containing protein